MDKIIYSKYSNDRNDNYKIRTDIIRLNNTEEFIVEKTGLTKYGKIHIEHMYNCYVELKKQFENTMIRPNVGKLTERGTLRLEYINGVTLEQLLDNCLANSDYEQFEKYIDSFCTQIRSVCLKDFVPDEMYNKVFGVEADSDLNQKSMACTDVDMIFENIVISNNVWNLIDYEWTFHISIPVDFVLFRAAHYYAIPDREKYLKNIDLYKMMGLNAEKIPTYEKMEKKFQEYVLKDNKPLWKLYETIGKSVCFPTGLAERRMKTDRIQVLKDYGDGFVGTEKYINVRPDADGMVEIDIDVEADVKTIRIDPAECRCVVRVEEMTGYTANEDYEVKYGSNGESSDNKQICFDTIDPQIWIGDLRDGLNRIHFKYHIDVLNDYMISRYIEGIDSFNNMRGELEKSKADLLGSNMLAEMRENEIEECKRIIKLKDAQMLIEAEKNEKTVNELLTKINEQTALLDDKDRELAGQDEMMRAQSLIIADKDDIINVQSERIRHLEDVIDGINRSMSWKITKPIRTVKSAVIKRRNGENV